MATRDAKSKKRRHTATEVKLTDRVPVSLQRTATNHWICDSYTKHCQKLPIWTKGLLNASLLKQSKVQCYKRKFIEALF